MGVVELVTAGQAVELSGSRMFPSEENHVEIAEGLVWDQSATAIQMIAHDDSEVPQATAEAFTQTVCPSERPRDCDVESRVEWAWNEIVYKIATLRTPGGFYFEFTDLGFGSFVRVARPSVATSPEESERAPRKHGFRHWASTSFAHRNLPLP